MKIIQPPQRKASTMNILLNIDKTFKNSITHPNIYIQNHFHLVMMDMSPRIIPSTTVQNIPISHFPLHAYSPYSLFTIPDTNFQQRNGFHTGIFNI
jgi:hypothetical protein